MEKDTAIVKEELEQHLEEAKRTLEAASKILEDRERFKAELGLTGEDVEKLLNVLSKEDPRFAEAQASIKNWERKFEHDYESALAELHEENPSAPASTAAPRQNWRSI